MATSQHPIHQFLRRAQDRWLKPSAHVLPVIAAVFVCLFVLELGAGGEAKSLWSGDASGVDAGQSASGRTKFQKGTRSNQFDVTFITNVPETDIYLQNEKMGTTGKDGKLLVKVSPGTYRAMAQRAGYYIKHQTITVRQGPMTVPFIMQLEPSSAATPSPTPSATPTPTPLVDDKTQCAAIMERFLDPKTTDQVKQPDWQNLLACTYQELSRSPSNSGLKAQQHFAQGQLDYLSGNFVNAHDAFLSATRVASDYALAHYGLAQVYLAKTQPQLAVKSLEQAIQLNPKLAMAYNLLGDAQRALKKEKEALAAYQRAYELGYLRSDASLNMARNLVKAERWDEALIILTRIVAESPSAEAYILSGDSYVGKNQRINAFQAYTKATELDDKSAPAFYKLGELHFRERNYEDAQKALGRALILDPEGKIIKSDKAKNMLEKSGSELRKLIKSMDKPTIPKP